MTNPAKQSETAAPASAKVVQLRPPSRWHDPLQLIRDEAPNKLGRIVLWTVSVLVLVLIVWAAFGKLDVIVSAEGRLTPRTLLKVVQPADTGVVRQLLVEEGDNVHAGQVLARLDATLANADKIGVSADLATEQMHVRRVEAELKDRAMLSEAGDDPQLFAQVQREYLAHRRAYQDSLAQEMSLLGKAGFERQSARETLVKLEQTLPTYQAAAQSFADLARDGYVPALHSADKQREAVEKARDLAAQKSIVAGLDAAYTAQQQKMSQLQSSYHSELEKELAATRAKLAQLRPTLEKTIYKEGQMELRAPQDGVIKDLATTTVGAVVQPGAVVLTLVPRNELLFADVNIKNEDVGFVREGQQAQIKLAAYPFQQYGMLSGKVIHVSADASEASKSGPASASGTDAAAVVAPVAPYKARIQLDQQTLKDPQGRQLRLTPGMQVTVEINQGKRTVLEYLLSPVQKAIAEAGHER